MISPVVTAQLCGAAWALEVFSSWAAGQSQQPREPHPLRGGRRRRFRGENIFNSLKLQFKGPAFALGIRDWSSGLVSCLSPAASLRYPPHNPLHQQEHPGRENSIRDQLWVPALLSPFFGTWFASGVVISQKSLPIWEANPGEAASEFSIIVIRN